MICVKEIKTKIKTHKDIDNTLSNYLKYYFELQSKNTRKKKRVKSCTYTKNNRGIYRFFQLSRHSIKRLAALEQLPGITKSSW